VQRAILAYVCDWWVVDWKQLGSDCDLVEVLTRDVSEGNKERHGKVCSSRKTFLIEVYSVTDTSVAGKQKFLLICCNY
jgi:hypothetical protein